MITSSLCRLIETCYLVKKIQNVEPLLGGEWNQVFRLDCERGVFVLRISHPTNTVDSLAYELRFVQFIHQYMSEIPAPLLNSHGLPYLKHGNLLITLFPFVSGRMLDEKNETECILAAQMFARLQRVGLAYPDRSPRPDKPQFCELDWERNHWWQWNKVEHLLFRQSDAFLKKLKSQEAQMIAEQIFAKRKLIIEEKRYLQDWVKTLCNKSVTPLTAPTHCDYWSHNILVKDGQISGVVDWDSCKVEWLFYALGRATWDFCKDLEQRQLNQSKAVKFLQVYHAAGGPVPTEEFELLIPVMRCVCLIEVLIGLQEAEERGLNQHELICLQTFENLQNIHLAI